MYISSLGYVDPTKLIVLAFHKFWLKDVGTNMCVPQYPFLIFPPKVSYTIIFKASWVLACNLCLGIWGLGHIVTKKITYEIVYYLRNVYETKKKSTKLLTFVFLILEKPGRCLRCWSVRKVWRQNKQSCFCQELFSFLILVQQPQERTWQGFNEDQTYPQQSVTGIWSKKYHRPKYAWQCVGERFDPFVLTVMKSLSIYVS